MTSQRNLATNQPASSNLPCKLVGNTGCHHTSWRRRSTNQGGAWSDWNVTETEVLFETVNESGEANSTESENEWVTVAKKKGTEK
jgi:hypothetical protein